MGWFVHYWRWLRRAPVRRADLHIILYTRAGCPLCDEAWELLQVFQRRYEFELTSRNVDDDDELRSAYGNCVPVVTINGRVRFRGHVNRILLQRLLDHKLSSVDPTP